LSHIRSFARFWWNFVVGDDWLVAAGICVALAAVAVLAHRGVDAWWLLPPAVAIVLAGSLRRATTRNDAVGAPPS
jgi:hypothetical protein